MHAHLLKIFQCYQILYIMYNHHKQFLYYKCMKIVHALHILSAYTHKQVKVTSDEVDYVMVELLNFKWK